MKQILRKISTCPNQHIDQIGFGALIPFPSEVLEHLFEDY
jgi:hypothetical protein